MRRGVLVAAATGIVSLGVHAAGIVSLSPSPPERLAGAANQTAMIGNSFEDASAGTVSSMTPSETVAALDTPAPEGLAATAAEEVLPGVEQTARAPVVSDVPASGTPSAAIQGTLAIPVDPDTASPVLPTPNVAAPPSSASTEPSETPMATATVALSAPVAPVRPVTPRPSTSVAPVERISARDVPVAQTPTEDTPRPLVRQPRPAPPPEPAPQPPPRQAQPQPQPQPAAPEGSAPETRQAGQVSGSQQGSAAQSQQGTRGQAASNGREVAQYPMRVNRHVARLSRPNARFDGGAVIAFTISPNGGLESVWVARSSGNADFDRIAMAHIRRGVPFPVPPAGAQRSFDVTVRGR